MQIKGVSGVGSGLSSYCLPIGPLLVVHFYSTVVIIVIVYHYSGRERKIVCSDDIGAVCRACSNLWARETMDVHDVGLICLDEQAQAETGVYTTSIMQCIQSSSRNYRLFLRFLCFKVKSERLQLQQSCFFLFIFNQSSFC